MAAGCSAIDFKRAESADETVFDLFLAPFWKQHFRGQVPARQAALERLAHHLGMTPQRLPAVLASPRHGIQVLVPEQGELADPLQSALDDSCESG